MSGPKKNMNSSREAQKKSGIHCPDNVRRFAQGNFANANILAQNKNLNLDVDPRQVGQKLRWSSYQSLVTACQMVSLHEKQGGIAQIFDDNRTILLRFLIARTRDPALAEDLLQEIWIKINSGNHSGPIESPLSYLYKSCENAVRDAKRSAARKIARETGWAEQDIIQNSGGQDQLTPEKIAIERDRLRRALAELEKLPERTREIFIDFRINEKSQKEIAASYSISISAVEKHLQRAYRVIKIYREKTDAGLNQL